MRVLIAGAGYIAEYHLAVLRENPAVTVVGVCDPHPDRLEEFRSRWGITHAAQTLPDLCRAVQADAVHVLTPPHTHVPVIMQALESGLHVLAEKPLTLGLSDTDALGALARRRGLRLEANHNAAWHPQFLRLKTDIAKHRLGAPQHVVAIQNVPLAQLRAGAHAHWMFDQPRNVLFEQGPHPLSQICDVLGQVTSATATCSGETTLRTGATFYETWQVSLVCEARHGATVHGLRRVVSVLAPSRDRTGRARLASISSPTLTCSIAPPHRCRPSTRCGVESLEDRRRCATPSGRWDVTSHPPFASPSAAIRTTPA